MRKLTLLIPMLVLLASGVERMAMADVVSPSDMWTAVGYSGPNQQDYFNDQQTGNGDADIVGNGQNPAFYVSFDDLGTPSLNDGIWYGRIRLGSDRPQAGTFDNNLFVGIDGNADGALDLFIGVHNQGSNNQLAIWDPGSGANVSPSTTSILSPPVWSTSQNGSNYNFSPVDGVIDPFATSFDLDGDGRNDWFLSFAIDFSQLATQMQSVAGISIDQTSQVSYVLATANNDNSLNQDLNGANGQVGSSLTWQQLGVMSNTMAIGAAIPEPASCVVPVGICIACYVRRRRVER